MRIVYDARLVGWPWSGLGRFAGDLLLALLESSMRSDVRVIVIAPSLSTSAGNSYIRLLEPHVRRGRCVVHHVSIPPISLAQQWALPRFLRCVGGDLYFYPHFDVPSRVPIPFLFVVHDLTPLKVPGYVLNQKTLKKAFFRSCVRRGLQEALRCVAVSATTKNDILDEFGARWGSKIDVSYEGSSLDAGSVNHALRTELGVEGQYLLYVGTRRPNKNIQFMIDVFANMRRRLGYTGQLVMAGSKDNFGFDVDRYVASAEGIRVLGPVTNEQLASLYAGMDSLIFLSKYEGFGLPVIEAAKFGRRMIVSDGGALREIAPASACVIPLKADVETAAAAAVEYLGRNQPQIDLSSYCAAFSWRSVAKAIFREAY
jgi:glycosyltransferase involved in cell wall biosynthesis